MWTGSEAIVWGGLGGGGVLGDGGRYDPAADAWAPVATDGAPSPRGAHVAAWTGSEMIIWGGWNEGYPARGARYDPTSDAWAPMTEIGSPEPRAYANGVWTGSELVVWDGWTITAFGDGSSETRNLLGGGRYDPTADAWEPMPDAPRAVTAGAYAWAGVFVLAWGGVGEKDVTKALDSGYVYDLGSDTWDAISSASAPSGRVCFAYAWTGDDLIVWGGAAGKTGGDRSDGGSYSVSADAWTSLPLGGAPPARRCPLSVWSGSEMIAWSGISDPEGYLTTGTRFAPASGTWTPMTTEGTPPGRVHSTAVWSGSEMIVWGGEGWEPGTENGTFFAGGGRYAP